MASFFGRVSASFIRAESDCFHLLPWMVHGLCKVQAKIPNGMKPGQTFTVQYTPMAAPAPRRAGAWCGNLIRMRLLARPVGVERVWYYLLPELHNFNDSVDYH